MESVSYRDQITPENIRNVCILAHVDHGKTSVADSLLSLNGLVSKRNVGATRFLDDRQDEQFRGITMKSSAVFLTDVLTKQEGVENATPVILNLVDTPGHIDFSTEVTAAVRICDGAIIVVDVVEGVCAQTKEAIKQAYDERLRMILLVNKIDRLVVDLKQEPKDMFNSILLVIEDCNAYLASLYHLDLSTQESGDEVFNEKPDLFFAPETGNVIFASAIDGWGFTLRHIAKMFLKVINDEDEDSLTRKLWDFDCFVSSKDKQIKRGAILMSKANLFVQLVTSTLHHVYTNIVINRDVSNIEMIIKKLDLKTVPSYGLHNDFRMKARSILEAWKPLCKVLLLQCYLILPSPLHISNERIDYLINSEHYSSSVELNKHVENNKLALKNCSPDGPVIAYMSKTFAVNKDLPSSNNNRTVYPKPRSEIKLNQDKQNDEKTEESVASKTEQVLAELSLIDKDDVEIIALSRIFSGQIRPGQELYLLNSTFDLMEYSLSENKEDYLRKCDSVKKITVTNLYLLLGREYRLVNCISAGYICGIAGLKGAICRTATLCSALYTTPIIEQSAMEPIVCNVVTPVHAKHLSQLREGLSLLQQSDSCVKVILNEAGEFLLLTAGDVHLEKCLEDLQKKFACVEFTISPPIYSLRETVNPENENETVFSSSSISLSETCILTIKITALPLPRQIIEVIKAHYALLKMIQEHQMPSVVDIWARYESNDLHSSSDKTFKDELIRASVTRLKLRFNDVFSKCNNLWSNLRSENIWRIGNIKNNINLLINCVSDYTCNIFSTSNECDKRIFLDNFIVNAFNMCCNAGPLCEEPLMNCSFVINTLNLSGDLDSSALRRPEQANHLLQCLHSCFREAFLKQNPSLMEPILATNIQTDAQGLGKIYSEVHKRYGKVVEALNLNEERKVFTVKAQIPAVESKGFANDIRKISSGGANPSLQFSHYELVGADPPKPGAAEDSDEEVDNFVRARKLKNLVRRRKGLAIEDDQVVVHAEKQRTLKK